MVVSETIENTPIHIELRRFDANDMKIDNRNQTEWFSYINNSRQIRCSLNVPDCPFAERQDDIDVYYIVKRLSVGDDSLTVQLYPDESKLHMTLTRLDGSSISNQIDNQVLTFIVNDETPTFSLHRAGDYVLAYICYVSLH